MQSIEFFKILENALTSEGRDPLGVDHIITMCSPINV